MSEGTGRVLFVCTGNICRSPLAAALLAAAAPDVDVASAGTAVVEGAPCPAAILAEADALGLDLRGHVSAPLTRDVLDGADLVLALAREHRAAVARSSPRAARRTFTLREAARLASSLDPRDREAVRSACTSKARVTSAALTLATRRGTVALLAPGDDDVVDPVGQSQATHALARTQITEGLGPLLPLLQAPSRHDG